MSGSWESDAGSRRRRWRLGVFAALALALLALFPQLDLCRRRGREWQGAYAYAHYDEDSYAAYLNGLILGRPRRSDPLIESQGGPERESIFSIQFVTPYLLAATARVTGFSAAQIFLAWPPLLAAAAAALLFGLLLALTGDERLSCAGALVVLCFATLAGRDGVVMRLLEEEVWYAGLPFLRRYQPGPSFLLFFLFVLCVWRAFVRRGDRAASAAAAGAGLTFALLVFSYFYMWTAAAAWLCVFALLWLAARPAEARPLLGRLWPLAVIGGIALAGYAALLTGLAGGTGASQALEYWRAPDLWRGPELVGAAVLAALTFMVRRGLTAWRDPLTLLAGSFAALPFVLFNQQVLTGLSLQPFHYEIFIGNYLVLLAAVLAYAIYRRDSARRPLPARALAWVSLLSLAWGLVEVGYSTVRERERNLERDRFLPVAGRLRELAAGRGAEREVVFSPETFVVADSIAGYAPQALLWATHAVFMPSLTPEQKQVRFFQYLYYGGMTSEELGRRLGGNDFVAVSALFGYERHTPHLTAGLRPLSAEEVWQKVRQYADFVRDFDVGRAAHPTLSYVIVRAAWPPDFSRLDRWYERGPPEHIGEYLFFRVKLRNQERRITRKMRKFSEHAEKSHDFLRVPKISASSA